MSEYQGIVQYHIGQSHYYRIDGKYLGAGDSDIECPEHDVDKREEKAENAPVEKFHRGVINAFGRYQQAHDVATECFGKAEKQKSHGKQEQDSLDHDRPHVGITRFTVAAGNDDL